eukprot:TRINITY_DN3809_c2_g1_i1.p1 TRINITY_DN3809_c2_g1~~TRINITY_DN3809_c2_g1_i1.p1  ORF type:complete len:668 (-),score=123.98 TRINITY_DN3809_c2_g1_i1:126-2129(-)
MSIIDKLEYIKRDLESCKLEVIAKEIDSKLNDHIVSLVSTLTSLELNKNSVQNEGMSAKDMISSVQELVKELTTERKKWHEYVISPNELISSGSCSSSSQKLTDITQASDIVAPVMEFKPELFADVKELGGGCFGTVYRAKYLGHIDVVIKVLNRTLNNDRNEELQKMAFLNEVRTMMQISGHENTLQILGALPYSPNFPEEWTLDSNGEPCKPHAIVMPYMPNGTLEDLLDRVFAKKETLTLSRKFDISLQILEGMALMESRLVQHCDIKPENVFFDKNWTVKIGDVGLSKISGGSNMLISLDQLTNIQYWSPPEVMHAIETKESFVYQLGQISAGDIYSTAIVLWQLFAEKPTQEFSESVFRGYSRKKFYMEVREKKLRPPGYKSIPIPVTNLLHQMWRTLPEDRPTFQSVLSQIKDVMIDVFLPTSICSDAASFWRDYFDASIKVPFMNFFRVLWRFTKKRAKTEKYSDELLKTFVATKEGNSWFVTIESFSYLLRWFGPLKCESESKSIFDKLFDYASCPWFFGPIDRSTSVHLLTQHTKGEPFLIRLNLSPDTMEVEPFVLSKREGEKISHMRIRKRKGGFSLDFGPSSSSSSSSTGKKEKGSSIKCSGDLKSFVDTLKKDSNFASCVSCEGNTFSKILSDYSKVDSYYGTQFTYSYSGDQQ